MPMPSDPPNSTLDRAALILAALEQSQQLTANEIAEATGLPIASTYRLLKTLGRLGWVHRCDKRFELGMRLFELGVHAGDHGGLRQSAVTFLSALNRRTGLVAHLAVLDGRDAVYLARLPHTRFAADQDPRPGDRIPAHCTSVGKAILACSANTLSRLPASGELPTRTSRSISSYSRLHAELATVRQTGVAFERAELRLGFESVAASIGPHHRAIAALSLTAPMSGTHITRLGPELRRASQEIWRTMRRSPSASMRD